jgi:hypothetical protein
MSNKFIATYLLVLSAIAFTSMITSVHALELYNYKDSATTSKVISAETIETAFKSNTPACLKEGAKLLGVNKAFKDAGLGYRDCSNSASRKRIHKAQGFTVSVFKLSELPIDMIKKIKTGN